MRVKHHHILSDIVVKFMHLAKDQHDGVSGCQGSGPLLKGFGVRWQVK